MRTDNCSTRQWVAAETDDSAAIVALGACARRCCSSRQGGHSRLGNAETRGVISMEGKLKEKRRSRPSKRYGQIQADIELLHANVSRQNDVHRSAQRGARSAGE